MKFNSSEYTELSLTQGREFHSFIDNCIHALFSRRPKREFKYHTLQAKGAAGMSDKKKREEDMTGDEMDVNAAQQIVSGAKQAFYKEDYKPKDDEERERKTEDEDRE